jgi:hypothetical protein
VGRHRYLSEHLASVFRGMGLETTSVVGLEAAVAAARTSVPDVVICDFDLLATLSLERWEQDELLARRPVVAASLTRRPDEQHLLDVNGIAGCLYLPTLTRETALRLLSGVCRPVPPYSFGSTARDWPRVSSPSPAR